VLKAEHASGTSGRAAPMDYSGTATTRLSDLLHGAPLDECNDLVRLWLTDRRQ